MATIGLCAYLFRVKTARSKEWEVMNHEGNMDIYRLLGEYFASRKATPATKRVTETKGGAKVSKSFMVQQFKTHKDSGTFFGHIYAGDHGRSSKLYDTSTWSLTHTKTIDEADMPPFYFRAEVPSGDTRGLLVFQKSGTSGIKSILDRDMGEFFAEKGITFRMSTLTDLDLLDAYLSRGEAEEIRVITHKLAKDSNDLLSQTRISGEPMREGTKVEVRLRRPKGFLGLLKKAWPKALKSGNSRDLIEVYGLENPEEVLVDVELDGKKRTFNLMRPSETGIMLDVTNEVSYGADNHPTFSSINREAERWCKELRQQLEKSVPK